MIQKQYLIRIQQYDIMVSLFRLYKKIRTHIQNGSHLKITFLLMYMLYNINASVKQDYSNASVSLFLFNRPLVYFNDCTNHVEIFFSTENSIQI